MNDFPWYILPSGIKSYPEMAFGFVRSKTKWGEKKLADFQADEEDFTFESDVGRPLIINLMLF